MISQNALKHANKCRFCWMCRHLCPVQLQTGKEINTPRAKGLLLSMNQRGKAFGPDEAQRAALRRQLGEKLWEKASVQFSIQRTVDTQREIYRQILRRHNRPRQTRDGVVICGAYGRGNAGDDAILEAIPQFYSGWKRLSFVLLLDYLTQMGYTHTLTPEDCLKVQGEAKNLVKFGPLWYDPGNFFSGLGAYFIILAVIVPLLLLFISLVL